MLILEIERISRGSIFHSFGAATWNDLSPKVALVRRDGSSSRRPLDDDLKLYAPSFLSEISSCKYTAEFPWMVLNVKRKILNIIRSLTGIHCSSFNKGVIRQ